MPHQASGPVTVAIPNNGTESGAINLRGAHDFAIYLPVLTTGTVRLQVSPNGTTWYDVYDEDNALVEIASNSGGFAIDGDYLARFAMHNFVRVKTGATQLAAREITYTIA